MVVTRQIFERIWRGENQTLQRAAPRSNRGESRLLLDEIRRVRAERRQYWWIANRSTDYYAMNALDAAALINQLQLLGNAKAELIVTSGRGRRADGSRHPHSWSIVDQEGLAKWVALILQR